MNHPDTEPADTAVQGTPPTRNRLHGLLRLALFGMLFLIISALMGFGLWSWIGASGMNVVDAHLDAARPWFMVWRIVLFALVIGFWPRWVGWLATQRKWPSARRQDLLGLRWRVAAWWVILELLLAQNLIGRALGY